MSLTPHDLDRLAAASEKRRRKLAQWIAAHPRSSEIEAARNPRHARMLRLTDPAECVHAIPAPAIDADSESLDLTPALSLS